MNATAHYHLNVTVVDNGSTDATLSVLRALPDKVTIIESDNLGYAGGNNLALRRILAGNPDYHAILIVNPDVLMPLGSIDRLAEILYMSGDIGSVSPHSLEETTAKYVRHRSIWGGPMNKAYHGNHQLIFTDRINGCCLLVKPHVFQTVGLFDEKYFLYWEENDWSFRALQSGFKLLWCYDIQVPHRTDESITPHSVYYNCRNQFRFARMNYNLWIRILFLAKQLLWSNAKEILGYFKQREFNLIRAALAGIMAGIKGETGPSHSCYGDTSQHVTVYSTDNQFG